MELTDQMKTCRVCANRGKMSADCKICFRNSAFEDKFSLSKEVEDYIASMKDGFTDSQDLHAL